MSRALIVFESMYGNNQQVASAIADGLRAEVEAEIVEVGAAPSAIPSDVSLLIVGGPNHATGLSRLASRKTAAEHRGKPTLTGERGLREWFDQLQAPSGSVSAVAYDTRMAKPRFLRWFDRASRGIDKRLRKRGFSIVAAPEHYYVTGEQGPLADGELDHARRWGEALATYVTATKPVS